MTRMHAGFTGVVPRRCWPRPRGWARPERLEPRRRDAARGRAALAQGLRALGHRDRRATCCCTGRAATSALPTRSRSRSSGATRRSRSPVGRRRAHAAARRRRTIVTARVRDDSGTIGASWFNQPWLAEKLTPGTHVRLRGKLGRYGFDVKSYDVGEARATADFAPVYPAERAGAVDAAARARPRGARRARGVPARPAAGRARPAAPPRRARGASTSRRPKPRPRRRGGGSRSTSCSRSSWSSRARATTTRCAGARRARASWSRATARCCRSC